jgi:hypothetical protein
MSSKIHKIEIINQKPFTTKGGLKKLKLTLKVSNKKGETKLLTSFIQASADFSMKSKTKLKSKGGK